MSEGQPQENYLHLLCYACRRLADDNDLALVRKPNRELKLGDHVELTRDIDIGYKHMGFDPKVLLRVGAIGRVVGRAESDGSQVWVAVTLAGRGLCLMEYRVPLDPSAFRLAHPEQSR